MASPFIVKAGGYEERFSRKKLISSLLRSGAPLPLAKSIASQVADQVLPGTTTKELFDLAHSELRRIDRPKACRYLLKRAIFDLGPTGFPFEQLMGRLFVLLGYEVKTNLILSGRCVDHEVDVIARRDGNVDWAECKFHNEQGLMNDVKTALYVYARFLDLSERQVVSGKKQMWLISNTRFSDEAIKFSRCRGVKLLGWNFPENEGINFLLEKFRLFPLTVISRMSKKQFSTLIQAGIVTCNDFIENKNKVLRLGVSHNKWYEIASDIRALHGE